MVSEVDVEALFGVDAEVLADHLYGQDFRIRELGRRTTLTQRSSFEPIIYQTENRDDEGAKIYEQRPPLRRLV